MTGTMLEKQYLKLLIVLLEKKVDTAARNTSELDLNYLT